MTSAVTGDQKTKAIKHERTYSTSPVNSSAAARWTPDDAGCQALIAERLVRAGFTIENLRYGRRGTISGRRIAETNASEKRRDADVPLAIRMLYPAAPEASWQKRARSNRQLEMAFYTAVVPPT